jgi:hypothetical protein
MFFTSCYFRDLENLSLELLLLLRPSKVKFDVCFPIFGESMNFSFLTLAAN